MNGLAITRAMLDRASGALRMADAPPDDAFRAAVEALLGGGDPAGDPDATSADVDAESPAADAAPPGAAPQPVDAIPADPALALFAAMPRAGCAGPEASTISGERAPLAARAETAAVVSMLPPADAPPTRAASSAPFAPGAATFAPPPEAAASAILPALPVEAEAIARQGDGPARLVATVDRVETHFAPSGPAQASVVEGTPARWPAVRPAAIPAVAGKAATADGAPASSEGAHPVADDVIVEPGLPGRMAPPDRASRPTVSSTWRRDDGETAGPVDPRQPSKEDRPRIAPRVEYGSGRIADVMPAARDADPGDPRPVAADSIPPGLARAELARVAAVLSEALRAPAPTSLPLSPAPQSGPLRIVSLTLDPEHLGRVTLTIRLAGERLSLHVAAERPETAVMIESDADTIAQLLVGEGFEIENLTAAALGAPATPLPAPHLAAPAAQLAGTGFAEGQSEPHHAPRDDRRDPANDTPGEGSPAHEEVDDHGRAGRLYV